MPCANTFLIGAQKSGTTYLASLLDQSPDVCVCDPKEPQFFSTRFDDGFQTYGGYFANPGAQILLDASTTYSFLRPRDKFDDPDAPGLLHPVPQRIKDACPEARFIYIMRDPVSRAMSAIRHNARSQPVADPRVSLLDSLRADPMAELISRYSDQIARYLDVFPIDRFLFLSFDELKNDPVATVHKTCDFLGIPAAAFRIDETGGEKHQAFEYTGLGRLVRGHPGLQALFRAVLPKSWRHRLNETVLTRPSELEFHDIDAAARLFEEDRAKVFEMTGLRI